MAIRKGRSMLRKVAWFALGFSAVCSLFLRVVVRSKLLRLIICVSQILLGRWKLFVWLVYSCISRLQQRARALLILYAFIPQIFIKCSPCAWCFYGPWECSSEQNINVCLHTATFTLDILSTKFLITATYSAVTGMLGMQCDCEQSDMILPSQWFHSRVSTTSH